MATAPTSPSRLPGDGSRRLGRAVTLMAAVAELRMLARPFRDAALDHALAQAEGRLVFHVAIAQRSK